MRKRVKKLLIRMGMSYAVAAALMMATGSFAMPTHPTPGATWTDPVTGMQFVYIPKGCYQMGQVKSEKAVLIKDVGTEKYFKWYNDELPRHSVCIDGFWMGKYEVTVGQFRKFIQATGYKTDAEKGGWAWALKENGCSAEKKKGGNWRSPGFPQGDTHPVVDVSWDDAVAFAKWLSEKTGMTFRLPTEAEWEYACRGKTKMARFWGDSPDKACKYANVGDQTAGKKCASWAVFGCKDGFLFTSPVGSFQPNGFGLYDMLGNVWEWCRDWYQEDYYLNSPKKNPQGPPNGIGRVFRGGSWRNFPRDVRCAFRDKGWPTGRSSLLGFRLVRIGKK